MRWLSISSDFGTIHSLKCVSQPKIVKKLPKTHILGFKVVQGHLCWYQRKGRQQCLGASMCLSATVLTLDEEIAVK